MGKAWILVGMMGAGKSSVGRHLSELSGREFRDTDLLLQNRFGRTISQIFQLYGEATFRAHETSVLQTLEPEPIVLATGGGIVMKPENWAELRRLGITCFLNASASVLHERLEASKKKRPLLETENWEQKVTDLLDARMPLYMQADFTLNVDPDDIAETARLAKIAFEEQEAISGA